MELISGLYLNKFVAPQLLPDFQNYNDSFLNAIPAAPRGAITADGLRANKLVNNVAFRVNNTDAFTPTSVAGQNGVIPWDKLDTTPSMVTDAEVRALSFDKRAEVRVLHEQSFRVGYRDYILHKLAPQLAAAGMRVMRTTGATVAGRKRLTFNDLIEFESWVNTLNLSEVDKLFLILSSEHQNDLKLDIAGTNNNRQAIRINPQTGEINGFYKLQIFENNASPLYDEDGALKPRGSVKAAGDQFASTFFYGPNTVKHLNSLKFLYKPEDQDTRSADPTSEIRLQVYGLADKTQKYGFGAIVSDNA